MEILFFALILLAIPFVLPIVAWVSARRTRAQLETLLRVVESQEKEIDELRSRVSQLSREGAPSPSPASQPAAAAAPAPRPPSGPSRRDPRRPSSACTCRPAAAVPPVVPPAPALPPTVRPVPPQAPLAVPEPRIAERPLPRRQRRPRRRAAAARSGARRDRSGAAARRRRLRWCLGLRLRLHLRRQPAGRPCVRLGGSRSA